MIFILPRTTHKQQLVNTESTLLFWQRFLFSEYEGINRTNSKTLISGPCPALSPSVLKVRAICLPTESTMKRKEKKKGRSRSWCFFIPPAASLSLRSTEAVTISLFSFSSLLQTELNFYKELVLFCFCNLNPLRVRPSGPFM